MFSSFIFSPNHLPYIAYHSPAPNCDLQHVARRRRLNGTTSNTGWNVIEKCLEDLECRIDPASEDTLLAEWKSFCDGNTNVDIFVPERDKKTPPAIEWPELSINSTLDNYEMMAIHQLKKCSDAIANGTGELLNVRCNYGTGILSSVFGAELFIMEEKLNALPTTKPISGGEEELGRILSRGIPDLRAGLGTKVFEMADKYREWMKSYPKVQKYVNIYHPDLQGSMDICELLYGSELFTALFERPEFIKQLLELITQTYIAFMSEWNALIPPKNGYATHWSMLHKGAIMLRDDSAMNFSPEMFEEFIRPYDQRLLNAFGGGAIHFCGKGDHYIGIMAQMDKLYAIHLSQPELNDMETVFSNTVDKGIKIIGLKHETAKEALEQGRDLRRCVHCW